MSKQHDDLASIAGGRAHTHHFDPLSGWCHHCNLRDDGRLVSPGGVVYRAGRAYTDIELEQIRTRHLEVTR